jgi:mRNA interferase MazF
MNRGDLVTIVLPGDLGKPRPALIIQSDQFPETHTVTVLPLSSTLVNAPLLRLDIAPQAANNLRLPSQVMIDKPMTVKRERIGQAIGSLDQEQMLAVNRALAVFLSFG